MKGTILALLVAIGLSTAPPQASAALQEPPQAVAVMEAVPAQPRYELSQGSTGLPARSLPPRTMQGQWPVFILFAVAWVAIVAYVVATGRRAARLAADLEAWEARR